MNANTPYAGPQGAGITGDDLSAGQRRSLRTSVSRIAARTRDFLPDEFVVGSEVRDGRDGLQVTVAVRPPVGNPVSAGFRPDFDADADDLIPADERDEVARGLAASAALQVKQVMTSDKYTPTAR
ncbi:DUF5811 family protein [Halocalculus aciditolerans]|nr:DUF5811 family protein [Halocalculus aciditolerans]